jgi:hypothetical protein
MTQNSGAENSGAGLEGRYANHFNIGYNAFEVVLEFGQFYEDNDQPLVHTRIVTSAAYARSFLELMSGAIEQYESTFGTISAGRPHE